MHARRASARSVNPGGAPTNCYSVAWSLSLAFSNSLGGYAADVFEFEDWALADRPRAVEPRLLADDARTLFTPHLGSAVTAVRERIEHAAADEIVRYARGEALEHQVN